MHSKAKVDHIINICITHKTSRVMLMEAVAFKEKSEALEEIRNYRGRRGMHLSSNL